MYAHALSQRLNGAESSWMLLWRTALVKVSARNWMHLNRVSEGRVRLKNNYFFTSFHTYIEREIHEQEWEESFEALLDSLGSHQSSHTFVLDEKIE